jgi:hypothetical protein
MQSWITRQAHANWYSGSCFSTTYLDIVSCFENYDFLPEYSSQFKTIARHIVGGRKRALDMTFYSYNKVMERNVTVEKKLWSRRFCRKPFGVSRRLVCELLSWSTTKMQGTRYCPSCLSSDNVPYFRLIWRLAVVPICVIHKEFLQSRCGNCQAPVYLLIKNPYCDIGRCSKCGFSISKTKVEMPTLVQGDQAYDAASKIADLVTGKLTFKELGWQHSARDFFGALKFLTGLLGLFQEGSTFEIRKIWKDTELAYRSLGEIWPLILDPAKLEAIAKTNQIRFNRTITQHTCPTFFQVYRTRIHDTIDWALVNTQIAKLADFSSTLAVRKWKESLLNKVVETTGCNKKTLVSGINEKFARQTWKQTVQRLKENRIERVKEILRQLDSQGKEPSLKAVSRMTGLGYLPHYLEKLARPSRSEFKKRRRDYVVSQAHAVVSSLPEDKAITCKEIASRLGLKKWSLLAIPEVRMMVRQHNSRRNAILAEKFRRAVEANPVSLPPRTRVLARQVGCNEYDFTRRPFMNNIIREIIEEAKRNFRHFYSSFACHNKLCPEYNSSFSGHLIFRTTVGKTKTDRIQAVLRCSVCGHNSYFNLEDAPLQRDYSPNKFTRLEPIRLSVGDHSTITPSF